MSGFIPHENVPGLLRVADLLVIPRKKALNSGNVALGFTFGTVVVGPDVGVIGEVLRETGNPVYDPTQPKSLGTALEQGIGLTRSGKGEENRAHAEDYWDWTDLAAEHVDFYHELIE